MKTCHSCGTEVKDKELVCPVCGATVVKSTGDFSLKAVEENKKKKKQNPMGTHVSTGSGLTDILRGDDSGYLEDDEDFHGGSIPTGYAKTEIDDFGTKETKKGSLKYVVILVVFLAVVFFGYNMYSSYKAGKRGTDSYEAVVDEFISAVNEGDRDKFDNLMPKYMDMNKADVTAVFNSVSDIKFESKSLEAVSHLNSNEISELQEDIKLYSAKTSAIQDAVVVTVDFDAEVSNASGGRIKKSTEVDLIMICVRERWFLEPYTSEMPYQK